MVWIKGHKKDGAKKPFAPPITAQYGMLWNKSTRLCELALSPWGFQKKLPWEEAIATELHLVSPVKAKTRKERRSLSRNGFRGGATRPLQRLAGC